MKYLLSLSQSSVSICPTHRVVSDPVLDPHQDHLLGPGAGPGGQGALGGGGGVVLLVHHVVGDGGPGGAGRHAGVPVEVGGAGPGLGPHTATQQFIRAWISLSSSLHKC